MKKSLEELHTIHEDTFSVMSGIWIHVASKTDYMVTNIVTLCEEGPNDYTLGVIYCRRTENLSVYFCRPIEEFKSKFTR